MFRLFTIWIFALKQTHSFVLQDSYNILLKDSMHYKISQTINYYETINEQTITFQTKIEDKDKFNSIERLAKQEYDKESKHLISPMIKIYQFQQNKVVREKSTNDINISSTPSFSMTIGTIDKNVADDKEDNYDYNYLNNEYYIEILNAMLSNKTYDISKDKPKPDKRGEVSLNKKEHNGKDEMLKGDVKKYKHVDDKFQMQIKFKRDLPPKLYYMIKILVFVYCAIAVPMWFTRGWCCCCLYCKVFKPRRTIKDAKEYLILYPPGICNMKKKDIQYEPSHREKERYEEFEHFLRTL